MKRLLPYIGIGIGAIFLTLLQVSVLPVFELTRNTNLVLTSILFLTLVLPANYSLYTTIFFGVLLDIFSYYPFGTILVILLLCWGLIQILQKNVLTNYSLTSLIALTIAITILYQFLLLMFSYGAVVLDQIPTPVFIDGVWFRTVFARIVHNIIVIILLYGLGRVFSKRFNKVFILR